MNSPFDRRFENGGTVTLEIGLHSLQSGNASIKVGKEFLDLGNDAALLGRGCNRKPNTSDLSQIQSGASDAVDNGSGSGSRSR